MENEIGNGNGNGLKNEMLFFWLTKGAGFAVPVPGVAAHGGRKDTGWCMGADPISHIPFPTHLLSAVLFLGICGAVPPASGYLHHWSQYENSDIQSFPLP